MILNKKILSLIKRKKMKLAIAESCTGGMLSSAITSVSGSSKVFNMGLVTYSNQAKINLLKVPKRIIWCNLVSFILNIFLKIFNIQLPYKQVI